MKIFFVSLGCDKNLVDSEKMLSMLAKRGFEITDDEEEAEAAVVNTCCFIGDAAKESIDELLRLGELRKSGQLKALVAAGCLAQRYGAEFREELPEVDAFLGTMSIDHICEALEAALRGEKTQFSEPLDRPLDTEPLAGGSRCLTTGGHYAYLKIAEGCNKGCTYCIIPKIRGPYRSIPMEILVKEAESLAEGGVKELILVAQETTVYGKDLYGKKMLPELLRKLAKIEGLSWIRVLYAYPEEIEEDLMEVLATEPKVLPYLDLPIQHACDSILKRMGRRTDQESLRNLIERLREKVPGICLRTTLISGFPGETQEEFEELYRFVNEMEFDRLGVFSYSQEEGTKAGEMEDQIPDEVKDFRRDELMELQQEICFEKNDALIGSEFDVLVEGYLSEDGVYVGRTYRDAPGVDGLVFFTGASSLMSGDMVRVRITGAREYDLEGALAQ